MDTPLQELLRILYESGAEDVPADEIDWRPHMTPVLMRALNMGYVRYRDRKGVRHFSLTEAGYNAIGLEYPTYSAWSVLRDWLSGAGKRGKE